MIALLQRVTTANVAVAGNTISAVETGLLVLVGIEKGDTQTEADRLADRIIGYRIFADSEDKMNLSVQDIQGGILLVPQFTLAADTRKGMRPSFSSAAADGEALFNYLVQTVHNKHQNTATGQFGADMKVSLVNDGPVTFWLQVGTEKPGGL